MILHDFPLSSASFRVRIVLALKGIDYQKCNYVLREGEQRAPDFLAVNPAGMVPALEVDGLRLGQSIAIIDYLDTFVPKPRMNSLRPDRAREGARIGVDDRVRHSPINNLRVLRYLGDNLGQDKETVDGWYRHWVQEGFKTLEKLLPDAPFAGGQQPNIVDACLVPQMFNARRFEVDLAPFPRVTAIADRAAALPAFRAAAPSRT